jgi:hypothetical protein
MFPETFDHIFFWYFLEVEEEIHFLFKCSKYEPDRKELMDIILTSCQNFNSLNDVKKLDWICNCENHNILTHLGVFLRKHYIWTYGWNIGYLQGSPRDSAYRYVPLNILPRAPSRTPRLNNIQIYIEIYCYSTDRKELIDIILTSCPNFNSLNDVKKLEWICNCENHNILTHLGVFLRKHCR